MFLCASNPVESKRHKIRQGVITEALLRSVSKSFIMLISGSVACWNLNSVHEIEALMYPFVYSAKQKEDYQKYKLESNSMKGNNSYPII